MAERFNCLRCRQMARDIRPAGNIVGPRVRRLRNARGWSQPELAARCQRIGWDVGRDIIARIESQVRLVTDSEILLLARALGTSVLELFPTQTRRLSPKTPAKTFDWQNPFVQSLRPPAEVTCPRL